MIEVTVPNVGESITEVEISQWLKAEGDWVDKGEDVVELESEKASVQVPAETSGYLRSIVKQEGELATVGEVIATIEASEKKAAAGELAGGAEKAASADSSPSRAEESRPAASGTQPAESSQQSGGKPIVMPAAQRLIDDLGLDASGIAASGPGGRLLKEDVQRFVAQQAGRSQGGETATRGNGASASQPPESGTFDASATQQAPTTKQSPEPLRTVPAIGNLAVEQGLVSQSPFREEEMKPMSMLRRTIASRLVQAQQTAALLTTFNEIDMHAVMQLRSKYRDAFAKKHGVKLGFMSFFAKAAVEALRHFPAVNAEIRDNQIVYRYYQDIGVAIGGGKGLVVPILRNVERMSFADIERSIADYATAAMENRLQPHDLEGGTFTISNGGIYGSLLSTPIVNPPQSGILGLHSIQQRPIALDGQVVIRPMMYVALTYDHRIVDGREAVSFLKTIKEVIEDPARLFLEV